MDTILITGGCGYIGSHTALHFLKHTDKKIIIVDNLSSGFLENFDYLDKKYPNRLVLEKIDLSDLASLEALFKKQNFSTLLHFAAALSVEESTRLPLWYYQNNTINTTNLFVLCLKYGVKKFIFSSTAAVYGEPKNLDNGITEDAHLMPINPYGASKMMSERILIDGLMDIQNKIGLKLGILRYFNVAGASMDNKDLFKNDGLGQRSKNATHLIKVALECATKKREKMAIFGTDYPTKDGTCIRDYIHIDDLASAHLCVHDYLDSIENGEFEIFNVGYGCGHSVKEVIENIKLITKQDFCIELKPPRAGDPAKLIANVEKIFKKTNWKPQFNSLETIIKSAYEWECYLS